LSRYVQPIEINLEDYEGYFPVEVFSKNKFPLIKSETPYFLTIGPHDCQWFILQKADADSESQKPLPTLEINSWKDLLSRTTMEELEGNVIPDYLMKVRWFGGKGRIIQRIKIIDQAGMQMVDKYNSVLLLIEVQYESGLPDIYQLAVSFARDHSAHKLQENCPKSVIANLKVGNEEGLLYDGLFGLDLQQEIIKKMANQETMTLKNSKLHFYSNKGLKKYVKAQEKIRSSILSAEQSNTSLAYDNEYFLKIYRKVDYAINPDLEITHFLTEKSDFKNIPAFIGAIEWKHKKGTIVMGMMQELVDNQGDAWSYMLDRVNNFYEAMLSKDEVVNFAALKGSITAPIATDDLPDDIQEMLTGQV